MSGAAAIPDAWKEWLLQNRDRGCDPEGLMQKALDQGFAREAIAAVLQASTPIGSPGSRPPHPAGASGLAPGAWIPLWLRSMSCRRCSATRNASR